MKNIFFFLIFSSMTIMLSTSCEQAELRRSNESPVQVVETRSIEDCEECPVEDCCCTISFSPDIPAGVFNLLFCGTTSPTVTTTPCSISGIGSCPDISGSYIEIIGLGAMVNRAQFCAALGQTFGITNLPIPTQLGISSLIVGITCQSGETSPQTIYVDLMDPAAKAYFTLLNNCILDPCF